MSVWDAPGKFAAANIAAAGSVATIPKLAVGISVWLFSHTSACTIDPPKLTLCLPRIHVAPSSMTNVDASRDDPAAPPPLVDVLPVFGFVNPNPEPQHAPKRFTR